MEKHEEANYIIAPKQVYAGTGCASLDIVFFSFEYCDIFLKSASYVVDRGKSVQYKISSHIDGTRVENIYFQIFEEKQTNI